MSELLRALIVEDSEGDGFFIVRELRRGGFDPYVEQVSSAESMSAALEEQTWDLIISDYKVPGFGGREALALYREKGLDIPFVIVSGAIGEETAAQMMKEGAHDYVMKDNLTRLASVIRRELQAAQGRRVRRQDEAARAHLAAIVESCEDAVVGKTLEGKVTSWNSAAKRLYGYTAQEMMGRSLDVLVPVARKDEITQIRDLLRAGKALERFETVRRRKDGSTVDVSLTISPIRSSSGEIVGGSVIARDISKRKQNERERARMIQELTEALARVKRLSGLLPICAGCKKIRNDAGYWEAVETYLQEHTEAEFTHSLCQDCVKRLYPDIADKLIQEG